MLAGGIDIVSWLQLMAFGGVAGISGQMIRVLAGLKKATEEAATKDETMSANMDNGRMIRSLMIGAVAGILAAISTVSLVAPLEPITREVFLAIMAAGYAGTDFIEAFMTKNFNVEAQAAAEAEAAAKALADAAKVAAAKVAADKALADAAKVGADKVLADAAKVEADKALVDAAKVAADKAAAAAGLPPVSDNSVG